MTAPFYWPENHPVLGGVVMVDPLSFSQWYSPQYPPYMYTPDQLPEDPDGLLPPGVGGDPDRDIAVGYAGSIPEEDVGPSNRNPRYGTDPEGHIHLTTNISTAWPRVSYPYLVEEVCYHSALKTNWY